MNPITHISEMPPIHLSRHDFEALTGLIRRIRYDRSESAEFLIDELNRAQVLPEADLPDGTVRLGNYVTYRDEDTGMIRRFKLTLPEDANLPQGKLSILTRVGAALIGLKAGQTIEWEAPASRRRKLTVIEVSDRKGE